MDSRINGATLALVTLAATIALSAVARGQRPTTRRAATAEKGRGAPNERTKGFMLGVHTVAAPGITLGGGAFEVPYRTSFGAGAGVMIGYGFNRTFSSYVAFDVAKQNPKSNEGIRGSFGLGHLELGARANLAIQAPNTVPYISGSVGRRGVSALAVDDDGDVGDFAMRGLMLGLGAGIEHFFSPTMSLDAGVQLGFGKFDHLTLAGHELDLPVNGTTSIRLRLGVTWRPRV